MEYLNDYNDNAKIIKIKFVFEVYVKFFIFIKMWTQMWIRRCSGIHYNLSCICVEANHFLFQWYLHKLCNGIIKYFWYKSIVSKTIYLTSPFRKLVLVVLNIYNTVHNYNIKKSGTITGKTAILEPKIQTNIWVGLWMQPQKQLKHCGSYYWLYISLIYFFFFPSSISIKLRIISIVH